MAAVRAESLAQPAVPRGDTLKTFRSGRAQHSLLATLVLPVAQALRLRGIDPLAVFESLGIDMACAANPDWRVPQVRFSALMARAVELSEDEAFGLVAAEQLQPQVLHGLGLAWLASDTVYDGLKRTARFAQFVSSGASLQLHEAEGCVHATFAGATGAASVPATVDYAVGVLVRMCQLTLGEFLAPLRVRMARPPPGDPARWEYMLCARVEFACAQTCITWPLGEIAEPLVTGDPQLARANDEQTRAYLANVLPGDTSQEVADALLRLLPDGVPDPDALAAALHLSRRTLQRRLRQQGTSYQGLLRDTRLALAHRYLCDEGRSVLEVAYLLGFSDPSTFSRAFKRWTGLAPAAYRRAAPRLQAPGAAG